MNSETNNFGGLTSPNVSLGLFLAKTTSEVIPNEIIASKGPESLDDLEAMSHLLKVGYHLAH